MIELLESRIAPASLTWKGLTSSLWSVASNWSAGTTPAVPAAGDTLFFDDTGASTTMINDTAPGTAYSLVFSASTNSYTLAGNSITLTTSGLSQSGSTVGISVSLGGPGGIALSSGLLSLSNATSAFTGSVSIAGGLLQATGSKTTIDPSTSTLGNPQAAGRAINVAGGSLLLGSSDIFGIDGSTPLLSLDIVSGTVNNTAGTFNTLGPVSLGSSGVLLCSGGISKSKQTYSLTGNVSSTGGSISSGGNAFPGIHIGSGVAFSSGAGASFAINATLLDQSPAHGSAPGSFVKTGAGSVTLSRNIYSAGTTIVAGSIMILSDGDLGAASGSVTMLDGSTLQTDANITTARNFILSGTDTFAIALGKTVTINGVVYDASSGAPGSIVVTGGGKLLLQNPDNTYTGSYTMPAGTVKLNGTITTFAGPGTVSITQVPGTGDIASIVLAGTTLTSTLAVTGPATTGVFKISIPDPNDHINSIILASNVLFGDGIADSSPDLFIAGKVNKLIFSDVNPNAILRLGSGLPYNVTADTTTPDSYNNAPLVTLRDVLGSGVTIDVTGDGTPAGVGGGGLGKVNVRTWAFPGLIKTTQSIDTFAIKRGDSFTVLEVDKFHNGVATPANVNKITCLTGKWNSAGTAIEGYVEKFDVGGFSGIASLSAAYVLTQLTISGKYPDPGNVALGGTITLNSATPSGLFNISIGAFTGVIDAMGSINSFTVAGNFSGKLTVDSIITKVQALNFVNGINDALIRTTVGGIGSIVATGGGMSYTVVQSAANIGNITLTGSGSTRSMNFTTVSALGTIGIVKIGTSGTGSNLNQSVIAAGANLGANGVLGGTGLDMDTWFTGGSIGDISIYGVMTASAISASVDLMGTILGGIGTDLAIGGGGAIGKVSLGAAAFSLKTASLNLSTHSNIITGGSINGLSKFGVATPIKTAANLNVDQLSTVIRTIAGELTGDLLLQTY